MLVRCTNMSSLHSLALHSLLLEFLIGYFSNFFFYFLFLLLLNLEIFYSSRRFPELQHFDIMRQFIVYVINKLIITDFDLLRNLLF